MGTRGRLYPSVVIRLFNDYNRVTLLWSSRKTWG